MNINIPKKENKNNKNNNTSRVLLFDIGIT